MLYETLSQPLIFLFMIIGGILSGFLFDLKNIVLYFFNKNKFICHFLMFFSCFSAFFIFFLINLKVNYGEFRFFIIATFALTFSLERFIIKNFVENRIEKCYNRFKEKHNARRNKRNQKKI